jgi:hypothetical protein
MFLDSSLVGSCWDHVAAEGRHARACTRMPSLGGFRLRLACCFSCSCWYQVLAFRLPIRPRPYSSLRAE